jgi:hypothetical protein
MTTPGRRSTASADQQAAALEIIRREVLRSGRALRVFFLWSG